MKVNKINESVDFLSSLAQRLDREGFVCIDEIISEEYLDELREEIKEISSNKGKYFSQTDLFYDENSKFFFLNNDSNIKSFISKFASVYFKTQLPQKMYSKTLSEKKITNVLRVVSGNKTSYGFHYDKTLITILIPIIIPKEEVSRSGHLITFPNFRSVNKYVIFNILQKLFLQNPLSQKLISKIHFREKNIHIMREGNIYIFNGYRTIHGNFPVDRKFNRATFLLHYGNPHLNSSLIRAISNLSNLIGRLKSEKF